jgi:gas vesicle protein
VAVGLVAGGSGLLLGLLVAPASGREIRRMWRRRAEEELNALERRGRRSMEDVAGRAKTLVEDTLERGKGTVSSLVAN